MNDEKTILNFNNQMTKPKLKLKISWSSGILAGGKNLMMVDAFDNPKLKILLL
jgi:hypothetical protein